MILTQNLAIYIIEKTELHFIKAPNILDLDHISLVDLLLKPRNTVLYSRGNAENKNMAGMVPFKILGYIILPS